MDRQLHGIFRVFLVLMMIGVAESALDGAPVTIDFSGYEWVVKSSGRLLSPGPNLFSNAPESVRVDENGALHLTIREAGGNWYAAEVFSRVRFDYGKFTFRVTADLAGLDPNIVFGCFTYANRDRGDFHQELDIEFSRWSRPTSPQGYFSVQPYDMTGNQYSFRVPSGMRETTHSILWTPDRVVFTSHLGHDGLSDENRIALWEYTGKYIPLPNQPSFRFNLWLFRGAAPDRGTEIVINDFQYQPLTEID